jgi:hypothetical protein
MPSAKSLERARYNELFNPVIMHVDSAILIYRAFSIVTAAVDRLIGLEIFTRMRSEAFSVTVSHFWRCPVKSTLPVD